jgi:hypothetical protein
MNQSMLSIFAILLTCACGGATTGPDAYEYQSYREAFPGMAPGCFTVWTESEDAGCMLLDSDSEPATCASGDDVTMMRPRGRFCHYAQNYSCDCNNRELETEP